MNKREQAAYDMLGGVQKLYRRYEVANFFGSKVEGQMCLWGALSAIDSVHEMTYSAGHRYPPGPLGEALRATAPHPDQGLIRNNDSWVYDPNPAVAKQQMRAWLRRARALLKKGLA